MLPLPIDHASGDNGRIHAFPICLRHFSLTSALTCHCTVLDVALGSFGIFPSVPVGALPLWPLQHVRALQNIGAHIRQFLESIIVSTPAGRPVLWGPDSEGYIGLSPTSTWSLPADKLVILTVLDGSGSCTFFRVDQETIDELVKLNQNPVGTKWALGWNGPSKDFPLGGQSCQAVFLYKQAMQHTWHLPTQFDPAQPLQPLDTVPGLATRRSLPVRVAHTADFVFGAKAVACSMLLLAAKSLPALTNQTVSMLGASNYAYISNPKLALPQDSPL